MYLLVDVHEIITQQDGMLLEITRPEVNELLCIAVDIGQVAEMLCIVLEGNERDEPRHLLDGVLAVIQLRRCEWIEKSREEDALPAYILAPEFDVTALEKGVALYALEGTYSIEKEVRRLRSGEVVSRGEVLVQFDGRVECHR